VLPEPPQPTSHATLVPRRCRIERFPLRPRGGGGGGDTGRSKRTEGRRVEIIDVVESYPAGRSESTSAAMMARGQASNVWGQARQAAVGSCDAHALPVPARALGTRLRRVHRHPRKLRRQAPRRDRRRGCWPTDRRYPPPPCARQSYTEFVAARSRIDTKRSAPGRAASARVAALHGVLSPSVRSTTRRRVAAVRKSSPGRDLSARARNSSRAADPRGGGLSIRHRALHDARFESVYVGHREQSGAQVGESQNSDFDLRDCGAQPDGGGAARWFESVGAGRRRRRSHRARRIEHEERLPRDRTAG